MKLYCHQNEIKICTVRYSVFRKSLRNIHISYYHLYQVFVCPTFALTALHTSHLVHQVLISNVFAPHWSHQALKISALLTSRLRHFKIILAGSLQPRARPRVSGNISSEVSPLLPLLQKSGQCLITHHPVPGAVSVTISLSLSLSLSLSRYFRCGSPAQLPV